uniref:Vitelline membrane outer layer protein 1 n=1 Tax=Cyprinus carpio carpio TaxID=630221 RepID=A0A9J8AL63_CYPCA
MHHFISIVFSLLIFTELHVSVQSTGRHLERSSERHFRSLLTVSNGMHWGSWGRSEFCPNGTYAKGFNVKVERHDYFDNTALNAIHLFCESKSDDASGIIRSDEGSFGQWIDYIQMCPTGFLTAFQLKVESSQGIDDDTAVNNIRRHCIRNPKFAFRQPSVRMAEGTSSIAFKDLPAVEGIRWWVRAQPGANGANGARHVREQESVASGRG